MTSSSHPARSAFWAPLAMLGIGSVVVTVLARHPFATNDGPVHVAFSYVMAHAASSGHDLQHLAYTVDPSLRPNWLAYFLLTRMMGMTSPGLAESLVQVLCLTGPMLAGSVALRTIDRRSVWLALFIFPLSLNQLFFLGLYNFCLSTAAFLLVIAAYLWMEQGGSPLRVVCVSLALALAVLAHAAGFISAAVGVVAMLSARAGLAALRGASLWQAVCSQRRAIVSLLLPLPFVAAVLGAGSSGPITFGTALPFRIARFVSLRSLQVNRGDEYVAEVIAATSISLVLLAALAWTLRRLWLHRARLDSRSFDTAAALSVAFAASLVVMVSFPDVIGGGWGHSRRFELFPWFWLLLLLAAVPLPPAAKIGMTAIATVAAFSLLGLTLVRQTTMWRQIRPLADADRVIGTHCTILPVVIDRWPTDPNGAPIPVDYDPYYHIVSRLEVSKDRVVLFNFLARLRNYPVRFRERFEPQAHLFHWAPETVQTTIDQIDALGFERSSGLHVDYVLIWGDVARLSPALRTQVETLTSQARLQLRSADGRLRLYRRPDTIPSLCSPPYQPAR